MTAEEWLEWRASLVLPADLPIRLVADRKFQRAALLALQGGRCATCMAEPTTSALCVDHEHVTGLTRGLLCRSCNGREAVGDDPVFDLYRANPPTAGLHWQWAEPVRPESPEEEEFRLQLARRRVWQEPT